eukprot:CAMPEP_0182899390 /NCGR_PEP_ID=MMETSP0034_2-20130328/28052_1 /TAXON_ID=156128 /ORGANISM="Nephroselmis pyriformis, Strain CCMP717" /LENGTH=358 /DNA_ID=CAMNT_0025033419 /DNA_START=142 /DNA_END=1214 /DNA_ORIENTATION=+
MIGAAAAPCRCAAAATPSPSYRLGATRGAEMSSALRPPAGPGHPDAWGLRPRPCLRGARGVAASAGSRHRPGHGTASSMPLARGGRDDARVAASAAEVLTEASTSAPAVEQASSGSDPYRPQGDEVGECGVDPSQRPSHVAVIMDGNSRWARGRRLHTSRGHEAGVGSLRRMVQCCIKWRIPALTVFAFSAENWMRSQEEVSFLLGLFIKVLAEEIEALARNNVRMHFVGDIASLPASLQRQVAAAEERTAGCDGLHLTLALSYGGRQDIVGAARVLAERAAAGELDPASIDEGMLSRELTTGHLPPEVGDPDLLIRTSGEQRLSNFLLWQMAYTELFFSDVLWPDFGEESFRSAVWS